MKYINAADVLPKELLQEISGYVNGGLLYIPASGTKRQWGEKSGSKRYYSERNRNIREQFQQGYSLEALSDDYGLSCERIRKIVRS